MCALVLLIVMCDVCRVVVVAMFVADVVICVYGVCLLFVCGCDVVAIVLCRRCLC